MPEVLRMNTLRVHEALAYLRKVQEALDEINTRDIRGLRREQLAALRADIRAAKEQVSESKRTLKAIDAAQKFLVQALAEEADPGPVQPAGRSRSRR